MSDPGARAAFSLRSIHTNAAVLELDNLYYFDKYFVTISDIYNLLIVISRLTYFSFVLINFLKSVENVLGN